MTAIIAAVLALLAGPTWAGCCTSAPATHMSGCHGKSAPEIHPPCCGGKEMAPIRDCCGQIEATAPVTASAATAPAPVCAPISLIIPAEPFQDAAPVRIPLHPPPLHADVGLYTLHAVFLI
jgi:hypothetical protein